MPRCDFDMSYVCLWEFQVAPGSENRFVEYYDAGGAWVSLFREADGFVDTQLLKDTEHPYRYVTVDRWTSASAYEVFRKRFAEQYAELDRLCENFTVSERLIGTFDDASEFPLQTTSS
jgi:heme-degrading monooxygenase HmoA